MFDVASTCLAGSGRALCIELQVQRDFEELPDAAVPQLRDSLLRLLIKHGGSNAPIRKQLCLAIAGLVAHVPAEQWGQTGVLGWLVSRMQPEQQDLALKCLLELLTILPQVSMSLMCQGCSFKDKTEHSGPAVRLL